MANNIIVYSSNFCHYCVQAKKLLERLNLSYQEINIQNFPEKREEMLSKSNGKRTVNESINIGNNRSRTLIKNESTFIDNKGNYGITTCLGTLENTLENVEFNLNGDAFGTFLEKEVSKGKFRTRQQR